MTQTKPLACSGGTIFAGQQGEKRTRWQVLRHCCFLSCGRWQSGRAVVMAASSYFNQTGSNRCAKPRRQLELRGMTAPCLLVCFFVFLGGGLNLIVREKKAAARNERTTTRGRKCDQWPLFCSPHCVINVTLQVESTGNFLCQQAPGQAAGIASWQRNPSSGACDVLSQSISALHSSQQEPCSFTIPWITSNKQNLNSPIKAVKARKRMSLLSLEMHTNAIYVFFFLLLKLFHMVIYMLNAAPLWA